MSELGATLHDFTTSSSFDQDEVENLTRRFGAAVLPGYVGGDLLHRLNDEFNRLFDDSDEGYIYKIGYAPGRALSIRNNDEFKRAYPAINGFFDGESLTAMARRYVGRPCLPNHEIYATHEFTPGAPVAPTHFDKLWTLKFMLYLADVCPGNAPFGIVPGSAASNRCIFRDIFESNGITSLSMSDELYQKMSNSRSADLDKDVVDIVGPAGTLIVFDTDTYHHASPVAEGAERKILRGHSGPYAQYAHVKKYSRQWWRGERAYSRFDALLEKALMRA